MENNTTQIPEMQGKKSPYFSPYLFGLSLIAVSLTIYLLSDNAKGNFLGITFINFAIAVIYFFYVWALTDFKIRNSKQSDKRNWINVVLLFTISAFALNREMHVFAPFPLWLNIYTISSALALLGMPYVARFSKKWQYVAYTVIGAGTILSLYLTLFLIPLTVFGVFFIWFFGLPIHAFVPIFWLIVQLRFIFTPPSVPKARTAFLVGMALPLLFLGFYLKKWHDIQSILSETQADFYLDAKAELPEWFVLSQKLPDDALTEEILMSPYKSQRFFDDFSIMGTGEHKFHDPLAVTAHLFFGSLDISQVVVEKLINTRYDKRHNMERRLWNGSDLLTSSVSTNVLLMPEYRLSYIEKTLVIHNDPNLNKNDAWRWRNNTQEALYTFHLPEGTVVTALSLWVNGVEEKSRLTTRQRADAAYTNIVGVERRDPALLHWQEGNRITVRVFPCTETEDRIFKIGFTQPMRCENSEISLENIGFEGPPAFKAQEAMRIRSSLPIKYKNIGEYDNAPDGTLEYRGKYRSDWKIAFDEIPLGKGHFGFNGKSFHAEPLTDPILESFSPKKIVLDITKEWTYAEYEEALNVGKNAKIYAFAPHKVRIEAANKAKIWQILRGVNFSIISLHQIEDLSQTLIITKTSDRSPLLSDLEKSVFAENMNHFLLENNEKCRVLNIGNLTSPFWKSLKELRLISLAKGNLDLVEKNMFPIYNEDAHHIALPDSKMMLVRDSVAVQTTEGATEHLMRVFVYNDLLHSIGKHYFERGAYETKYLRTAEEAFVVSPVTSLVVLESKADYDRFGIKTNKNTLGNASISGGAVPEPHEWLLIGLSLVFAFYFYRRR